MNCQRCNGPLEPHRQDQPHCCGCANIIFMCTSGWLDRERGPNDYFDDGLGE